MFVLVHYTVLSITNKLSGESFGCSEAKQHGPEAGGMLEMYPIMMSVEEEAEHLPEKRQPCSHCASVL